jgi:hypothetical protein
MRSHTVICKDYEVCCKLVQESVGLEVTTTLSFKKLKVYGRGITKTEKVREES